MDRGYNDCLFFKDLLIFITAIFLLFVFESTFLAVCNFPRDGVDPNRDSFCFVVWTINYLNLSTFVPKDCHPNVLHDVEAMYHLLRVLTYWERGCRLLIEKEMPPCLRITFYNFYKFCWIA